MKVMWPWLSAECVFGRSALRGPARAFLGGLFALVSVAAAGAEAPADRRLPTLALCVAHPSGAKAVSEKLGDVLFAELSAQPFFQLVERQALRDIVREQEIGFAGLTDAKSAIAVGKLIGAELLLFVQAKPGNASLRLVEVGTGKVLLEEELAMKKDLFLTAAAVRERILKALRPGDTIAHRVTVGIAAFANKSGADRSDRLNAELQKALRVKLRRQPWATVLERQYPTGLLEEVDLARLGLARGATEDLPPADMAAFGTLEDVSKDYGAKKGWEVKLELFIRFRERVTELSLACQSTKVADAADRIVKHMDTVRRGASSPGTGQPEAEIWRRHALYLMPRSSHRVGRSRFDCISQREKVDAQEAIRAWENVLLLEPDNVEAKLNLGVCLISLHHGRLIWGKGSDKKLAQEQSSRGSLLVEEAMRTQPNAHHATTLYFMAESLKVGLPPRSAQMFEYIVKEARRFSATEVKFARIALGSLQQERIFGEIDRASANVQSDPSSLVYLFTQLQNKFASSPDRVVSFLSKHRKSKHPLVRFLAERTTAEMLWRGKKDPSALAHYDRAIEVHEGAYAAIAKCGQHHGTIDDIYRYRLVACQVLKNSAEARETVLRGVRHFMAVERLNHAIAWLYGHCVTTVLTDGDAAEGLAICDAYLRAAGRPRAATDYYAPITVARERFAARKAGVTLPDFKKLTLVKGTETTRLHAPRMAIAAGKIWLAWQHWQSGGPAMVYDPQGGGAIRLRSLPAKMRAVAAVGEKVFFGGLGGLYELDSQGKVARHYEKKNNELPSDHIVDLCAGRGKLYLSFRESDRYGVAALDPGSGTVTVLAPTSREAKVATEPVRDVYRVWWDPVHSQVYANNFYLYDSLRRYSQHGWMLTPRGWQRLAAGAAFPRLIVSHGTDALQLRIVDRDCVFEFLGGGERVRCRLPLPALVGEPAWDERRLWVPTYAGLYQVDRATGQTQWLAFQKNTHGKAVVKHGGRLYFATTQGLYWRELPE